MINVISVQFSNVQFQDLFAVFVSDALKQNWIHL